MERRSIKAVFFDIDGTLADESTCEIPESTVKAMELAAAAPVTPQPIPGMVKERPNRLTVRVG